MASLISSRIRLTGFGVVVITCLRCGPSDAEAHLDLVVNRPIAEAGKFVIPDSLIGPAAKLIRIFRAVGVGYGTGMESH